MAKKYIVILSVLTILLSGCLQNDDSCHYFSLVKNVMYSQTWKVDSFTVYVYDSASASGYRIDTTYINDGNLKFIPISQSSCIDSGNVLFAPPQGTTITLQYTMEAPGPYSYGLIIQSPTSIDNLQGGDTNNLSYNIVGSKLYLINTNPVVCCGSNFQRIWDFVLSKN